MQSVTEQAARRHRNIQKWQEAFLIVAITLALAALVGWTCVVLHFVTKYW
jgi:cell shape-determining protein MreD